MMNFTELASVPSAPPAPFTDQLRPAVAAYLARFKGSSRYHTESDLRCPGDGYTESPIQIRGRSSRSGGRGRPLLIRFT